MDGLTAVAARVSQIQGLVQGLSGGARIGGAGSDFRTSGAGAATGTAEAFDVMLDKAKGLAGAGTSTGVSAASRAMNADGVPLDLVGFGNGKVPSSALAPIGVGSHRLWQPAAEAFTAMVAKAKSEGVTIGVTDSYRSYASQVDLAQRKGLYSQGGLAAAPGTSDHGWGIALDLDLNSKAQTWMRANAGQFGFVENVPREPWHWTFQP